MIKWVLQNVFWVGVILDLVWSQYTVCNDEHCLTTDGQIKDITGLEYAQSLCTGDKWLIEISTLKLNVLLKFLIFPYDFRFNAILLNMDRGNNSWVWNDMKEANVAVEHEYGLTNDNAAYLSKNSLGQLIFVADQFDSVNKFICMKKVSNVEECNKVGGWSYRDICYFSKVYTSTWFSASLLCDEFFNATMGVFDGIEMPPIPNSWISSLFVNGDEKYWLGLTRKSRKWVHSGQVFGFNRFESQLPLTNDDCLKVHLDGWNYYWHNTNCSGSFMIVCMSLSQTKSFKTDVYLAPMIAGWVVAGVFLVTLVIFAVMLKLRPRETPKPKGNRQAQDASQTYDNNEVYETVNRDEADKEDISRTYAHITPIESIS